MTKKSQFLSTWGATYSQNSFNIGLKFLDTQQIADENTLNTHSQNEHENLLC